MMEARFAKVGHHYAVFSIIDVDGGCSFSRFAVVDGIVATTMVHGKKLQPTTGITKNS